MKKSIHLLLIAISLLFVIIPKASATHLVTAELGWNCIGQDSFMIKLTVYEDCNTASAAFSPVSFYCAQTWASLGILSLPASGWVDVTPICNNSCTRCQSAGCSFPYGIKRYIMQGLIDLSGAGSCCQIKMTWAQCCKTTIITTGSANNPLCTEAVFDRCQSPGYSSPQFVNDPLVILCVGQDVVFPLGSIFNVPGSVDSLTFDWADTGCVSYIGSYDSNKAVYFWGFPNAALPFPRGLHLDPQTGDILFRPMKAETTVMGVKIKVFQKNVQISVLRRELFIIVITCTNNNPPLISTQNNVRSKSICAGETGTFEFSTSDANPDDTVSISWNKAISGAIWIDSNGLSKYPKATLSWTPNEAQVSSLPYTFFVTARDNACPVNAKFTQAYQITVKPKPRAHVNVIDSGCGNYWFTAQKIIGSGPVYLWQSQKFSFSPNTGNIIHHVFQPGIYPYSMTMAASGCITNYFDTLIVLSDSIGIVSLPADTTICSGTSLIITPRYFYGEPPFRYYWNTGDTNKILHTGPIYSDLILKLTVTDSNGCNATDEMRITALRNPEISSDPFTPLCYNLRSIPVKLNPGINVFGSNNSVNSLSWQRVGDTLLLSGQSVLYTKDPGHYVLKVTDKFGCMAMDTMQVILTNPIDTSIVISDSTLFAAPGMKRYDWYLNDSFISSSQVNSLIVRQKGWYFSAITDSFDCIDSTRRVFANLSDINHQLSGMIRIYPNPTKGMLLLETNEEISEDLNISIFNALGMQVMSQTRNRNNQHAFSEIDLSALPSGTYTIVIHIKNNNFYRLVIKE